MTFLHIKFLRVPFLDAGTNGLICLRHQSGLSVHHAKLAPFTICDWNNITREHACVTVHTETGESSTAVKTGTLVLTRAGRTLINVALTPVTGVARWTVTPERARNIDTRSIVLTGRQPTCGQHHTSTSSSHLWFTCDSVTSHRYNSVIYVTGHRYIDSATHSGEDLQKGK